MQSKKRFAALLLSAWLASGYVEAEDLTLTDATQKAVTENPLLNVYALRKEAIEARREVAALRPGFELGIEVENFAGTDGLSGIDEAEITASLSSVIELGSKRSARMALVDSRAGMLRIELEAKALDMLGAMTSQFISALASREQLALAQEASTLAEKTSSVVEERTAAGVSPDAELLRAKAAELQIRTSVENTARKLKVAMVGLGTFWGERSQSSYVVQGDLFAFGEDKKFAEIWDLAVASPAIKTFANESRLREAELRLAESQNKLDIRWSLGIRRLEGLDDSALVGSLQFPLNSGRRNRGAVAAVRAERAEVEVRREQALNQLYARLYDAYATRKQNIVAVDRLSKETVPALTEALEETQSAFEAGLYSYLELIAAQRALIDAKQTKIATAAAALQAAVIIEQLTGISLQSSTDVSQALQDTFE